MSPCARPSQTEDISCFELFFGGRATLWPGDVGPRKILATKEQWHPRHRRYGLRHAVAEVQASRMTAPSKPQNGGRGSLQVFFVKRHHFGLQVAHKSKTAAAGIPAQAGGQNHRGIVAIHLKEPGHDRLIEAIERTEIAVVGVPSLLERPTANCQWSEMSGLCFPPANSVEFSAVKGKTRSWATVLLGIFGLCRPPVWGVDFVLRKLTGRSYRKTAGRGGSGLASPENWAPGCGAGWQPPAGSITRPEVVHSKAVAGFARFHGWG
jgi:hypothetical protein